MTVLTPAFIAYDQQDRSFVNLLHKLLEHEGIESSCTADKDHEARSLLVVVSEHAVQSARVRTQLATFRLRNPNATIIPILLDATRPTRVDRSLESFPTINMYEDMLAGFVELFARYSRRFLAQQAQSRGRAQADRRSKPDRRGDIRRRLRVGLWQQFAHTTGLGKFDTIELTRHASAKIVSALQTELTKYELRDENERPIDSRIALQQALAAIDTSAETKAVYLVEQLVKQLYNRFHIRCRDRRVAVERRVETSPLRNTPELRLP